MSATQEIGDIFGAGSGPAQAMLRSPTVLIASVGLWGMNIFFFRWFGIDYIKVLKYDLLKLEQKSEDPPDHDDHDHDQVAGGGAAATGANGISMINNGSSHADGSVVVPKPVSSPTRTVSSSSIHAKNGTTSSSSSGNGTATSRSGKTAALVSTFSEDSSDRGETTSTTTVVNTKATVPLTEEDDMESAIMGGGGTTTNGGDAGSPTASSTAKIQQQQQPHHGAITWERLVAFSLTLLFLLHTTSYVWIEILGGGSIGAVFAFYGAVGAGMLVPLPKTLWLRKATYICLSRAFELINPRCSCLFHKSNKIPPRPIPFVDVFFADAMCSLSKVFFDWGMLGHMALYYPNPVPKAMAHIVVPSAFAAVPYFIRARQCLIMYMVGRIKQDPKRYSHLWNALKYSTSIFPLLLSAYQKTVSQERAQELEPLLIVLLVINAFYALYWDIVMDWGMMQNPSAAAIAVCLGGSGHPVTSGPGGSHDFTYNPVVASNPYTTTPPTAQVLLRPRLRFGVYISFMILLADSILRFGWTLRFYHNIFPSNDSFVLCSQFLEVFRRALWNLLRVEWENLKQMKHNHHHPPPNLLKAPTKGNPGGAIMKEEEMVRLMPKKDGKIATA